MTASGQYRFFSFLRRGTAADLTEEDPLTGEIPYRGKLNVSLTIQSAKDDSTTKENFPSETTIQLYGPGDVVGIDPRHIIRTDPRDGTTDFEQNYSTLIEFEHPDFPWLFSPAAPSQNKLRPWLSLIVLADGEFDPLNDQLPVPLPAIIVKSAGSLPNLDDSWAWAHVQVVGELGDLESVIAKEPGRIISRLLCPRRLKPKTHYTAFLVPAFDLGVKAGLGDDKTMPGNDANAKASPAWQAGDKDIKLPVYYRFEFHTSEHGNFESLARQLQPLEKFPDSVGKRPMAVDQVGWELPSAGSPLDLTGALRTRDTQDTVWSNPGKDNFETKLVQLLNLASGPMNDPEDDPIVVPPIYGRWHAGVSTVDLAKSGWVNELNTDPRFRSMAGFGTRVVLDQITQLMAAAWKQVAGIVEANQLLRQAQLARASLTQVYTKHIKPAEGEVLLWLTLPLHKRLRASPTTVYATIAQSRLPVRALSAAFRRIARPIGPIRRRQGMPPSESAKIISQLNSGEISPVPPVHPPDGMASLDDVSDSLYPKWAPGWLRPWLQYATWILIGLAIFAAIIIVLLGILSVCLFPLALQCAVVVILAFITLALRIRPWVERWKAAAQVRTKNFTPNAFRRALPRPHFQLTKPGQPKPPEDQPALFGTDSPDAHAFRRAAIQIAEVLQMKALAVPDPPPINIPDLQKKILERINPAVTVPARVKTLVKTAPTLGWEPEDPLEPIMAAPEFPQPMYKPLRDLSQDLLLPGLEAIPPNSIALLQENHAFIEAYMAGLNHEMGRQLLWHGYPTDQRGSYFRQFWDVSAYVKTQDDLDPNVLKEKLKDIPPLHLWPRANKLGNNKNRSEINSSTLILLIRGQLLQRYPNTIIYAVEAKQNEDTRVLGETEKHPLFTGTLKPDITFLGFELTLEQARGSENHPGWFFVFQEQPSEPRFGLDEPDSVPFQVPEVKTWRNLSWANFVQNEEDYKSLSFAGASVSLQKVNIEDSDDNPDDSKKAWGKDSAQMAFITWRYPFRVAIHARTLLP